MPRRCPHCGAELPPVADAFCPQCRQPLDDEVEAVPEPPEAVRNDDSADENAKPEPVKPAASPSIDLVTITTYANPQEAAVARAALAEEGIAAYAIGEEAVNVMWYVGSALGGVRLQVATTDQQRAHDVLRQIEEASQPIPAWVCPSCGAEVDEGFAVCWSCGTAADAGGSGDAAVGAPAPQSGQTDGSDVCAGDDLAGRAWRAAVFGVLFTPAFFYACYLILKAFPMEMSRKAERRYYWAMVVAGATFAWLWMWFQILSR